jgi:ribosomal protein L32
MSTSLCPNCDIPLENNTCPKCGFKHTVVITKVTVDKEGIKEEIKNELRREENEPKALQFLEDLKEELSEKYPAYIDLFKDANSPSELYEILSQARSEKTEDKKPAPHGKAQFLNPNDSGFESHAELIDKLYFDAYYNPEADEALKKSSREKIDQLFDSLISGRSWEQLKRSKVYDAIIKTNVESCPNCGKTLIDGAVCSCGYDPYSKKHRPRVYQNPLVK